MKQVIIELSLKEYKEFQEVKKSLEDWNEVSLPEAGYLRTVFLRGLAGERFDQFLGD